MGRHGTAGESAAVVVGGRAGYTKGGHPGISLPRVLTDMYSTCIRVYIHVIHVYRMARVAVQISCGVMIFMM